MRRGWLSEAVDKAMAEYRLSNAIADARMLLRDGRELLAMVSSRYPLAQSGRRAAAAGNNKACNHD